MGTVGTLAGDPGLLGWDLHLRLGGLGSVGWSGVPRLIVLLTLHLTS